MFSTLLLLIVLLCCPVVEPVRPTRTQYATLHYILHQHEFDLNSRWHFERLVGDNLFAMRTEQCTQFECRLRRSLTDSLARQSGLECVHSAGNYTVSVWYEEFAHRFALGESSLHIEQLRDFTACLVAEFSRDDDDDPEYRI